MTSSEIRRQFIEFFRERGHTFVPSAAVVPLDDPTLLFTNAGMNQFKDVFLGTGRREYRRAVNSQKCIRAGGKHNDLDDVGHDTYHHTFFEMLGNWSFGDYFKKEAILWAWELLTEVWKLPKDRLHATVFEGDAGEGLAPDDEAAQLWRSVTDISPTHIHKGYKKDNFWEMGDTGPCGPCSEIHIDLTEDKSGRELVNVGDPRVIEIWNLVFIQFNRGADGKLTPLPAKHVDTGMGLERVTAVVQGKRSNYDTDLFAPIFAAIQRVTGAPAYTGLLETDQSGDREGADRAAVMKDVAYRVIADHIRTLTFALTDGAVPSNEGRGYVLRRILRRAVRYGRQYVDTQEPFLLELVPTIVEHLGDAFPELGRNPGRVIGLIRDEEVSFGRTLDRGIALFDEAAGRARASRRIAGEDAFRLHDTYGFPIDLTQVMATEKGLDVDIAGFDRLMEEARRLARRADKPVASLVELLPPDLVAGLPQTDDSPKYVSEHLDAEVTAIVRFESSGTVTSLATGEPLLPGERAGLVLDRTCFYAEQGGQVGDCGQLSAGGDARPPSEMPAGDDEIDVFAVEDTRRLGSAVLHVGTMRRGAFALGEPVQLRVDARRKYTKKNHTATHVMNWALREVFGEHVQQKGSLVDAEHTRFDFAHIEHPTVDQIKRIEELVNERLYGSLQVFASDAPQDEALKIDGLRAVFGEKYPPNVRVVSIGVPVEDLLKRPENPYWRRFSVELCGGTHVKQTGEVGFFKIVESSAVAKGVRRITAITAAGAMKYVQSLEERLTAAAEVLKVSPDQVAERVGKLLEEIKALKKQKETAAVGDVKQLREQLARGAERLNGVAVIVAEAPDVPAGQLREMMDYFRAQIPSGVFVIGTRGEGKCMLIASVTDDLVGKGVSAGEIVKTIAPTVGGSGGGKPTLAQAGGKEPDKVPAALEQARALVRNKLA